jgi:hypothetical protein
MAHISAAEKKSNILERQLNQVCYLSLRVLQQTSRPHSSHTQELLRTPVHTCHACEPRFDFDAILVYFQRLHRIHASWWKTQEVGPSEAARYNLFATPLHPVCQATEPRPHTITMQAPALPSHIYTWCCRH